MKCHICDYDIPAGKKFCPGCGRVLTAAEQKKAEASEKQTIDTTVVYRPASTGKAKISSSDPSIDNIFNKGDDTPEYRAEQAYSRATADVVEYDKMFMSRKDENEDTYEDAYDYPDTYDQTYDESEYEENDNDYTIEPEYDDDNEDEKDNFKSFLSRINVKTLIICIALIAGIAVIVTGVYQIGKEIGLWGEGETQSQSEEEEKTLGEKAPIVKEPDSTTDSAMSEYKIGIYTVTSTQNNVFMQKSKTDDRVIATVPNGTVIEITEISDDMGKTTFGSYTGWLFLEDLSYTPDAKLTETETTTQTESNSSANADANEEPDDAENTTKNTVPDSPGTYTVDLQGDGTYLNVRDASSADGNVVTTINEGIQVTVDKVEHGWGHITTPDGSEGWIYMVYLK